MVQKLLGWSFSPPGEKVIYTIGITSGMSGEDVDWKMVANWLVAAEIWEEVDGGYYIHDYPDYQPLKAEIEELKQTRSEVGRMGGQASATKRQAKGQPNGKANGQPKFNPNPNPIPIPNTGPDPDPGEEEEAHDNFKMPPVDDEERTFLDGLLAIFAPRKFHSYDHVKRTLKLRGIHGEEKIKAIFQWAADHEKTLGEAVSLAERHASTWDGNQRKNGNGKVDEAETRRMALIAEMKAHPEIYNDKNSLFAPPLVLSAARVILRVTG